MTAKLYLLLLSLCLPCLNGQSLESIPSSPVLKKPGETLSLSCKISGYTVDSHYTHWIRQPAGKSLEWMGYSGLGLGNHAKTFEGRMETTKDNSNSMLTLKLSVLRAEDSAVYYCARERAPIGYGLGAAFDYWGKGTQVTVSTATTAPSSLFPLTNCGTPTNDIYSIGCVATGFSPSSISFKWTDAGKSPLTDFVQYPSVQSGGAYIGVSQLRLSKNVWENSKSFICSVEHLGSEQTAVINKPVSKSPSVSLLSGPIGTTQYLMCMIEDFTPNKVTVTWKKNDKEVEGQTPTVGLQPSGLYSASSLLKVNNTDWNNKVKYSCVVQHQGQTTIKTISKTEPLTVTLNPPSVKKVFMDNQAVLDCVITATDQNTVAGTTITWQVNGKDETERIVESKGNLNSRVSTLTIDQTEWTNVNNVQCSAMKRGEDTPVIQDISFTKGSRAPSVSVHLLPEEDTKKQGDVTLVCLVVSPSLCDIYIMWKEDSGEYQDGVTSPPQKTPEGNYSVTSVFTVKKNKWEGNSVFACAVKHRLDNNTAPQERSVSKSMGNILLTEPEAGFALSCTDNVEDEFGSLWSTTSSFIILFLLSLTYSTVLSLVKMKQ